MRGKNFANGGRVKVGVFNENQLRNKEDKKAVEKAQKETGLNYTDTKIIKKAGQKFLEVYLIPNEEYYNSSKFNKGGGIDDDNKNKTNLMEAQIKFMALYEEENQSRENLANISQKKDPTSNNNPVGGKSRKNKGKGKGKTKRNTKRKFRNVSSK